MTSALAILPIAPFIERPNALLIEHVTYDEWLARGKALYAEYNKVKWYIIDWMRWGYDNLGEEFWQGVYEAGYKKHTIDNNLRIHKAYPTANDRVLGCSVSAHEAAIVLPPQQRYRVLEQAAREGEGRDWVRDEVRRIKGDGGKVEPEVQFDVVRGGMVKAVNLPHQWEGKHVQITIKVLEKVA